MTVSRPSDSLTELQVHGDGQTLTVCDKYYKYTMVRGSSGCMTGLQAYDGAKTLALYDWAAVKLGYKYMTVDRIRRCVTMLQVHTVGKTLPRVTGLQVHVRG